MSMSDVFISYAREAQAEAHEIAVALRALGNDVWRDDQLPAHRAYADVIEERLKAARAVVVVWSAEAVKSHWVRTCYALLAASLGQLGEAAAAAEALAGYRKFASQPIDAFARSVWRQLERLKLFLDGIAVAMPRPILWRRADAAPPSPEVGRELRAVEPHREACFTGQASGDQPPPRALKAWTERRSAWTRAPVRAVLAFRHVRSAWSAEVRSPTPAA
jgi:hypothetical protein